MTIEEKTTTTFTASSLPGAPARKTRTDAEADEARGVELAAFLAVLPTLTEEQWDAAWDAAWVAAWGAAWGAASAVAFRAAWDAAWGAAWDAAWDGARGAAAWAAVAIVARDLINPDQFDILTAPMRAAGVDFDGLVK